MSKTFTIFLVIIGISFLSPIIQCTKLQTNTSPPKITLQKSIFIAQANNASYFYYNVFTQNNRILIKILNKDLRVETFTFAKNDSKVEFRDAYNRYIIVQQMDTKKNISISYWVIKIVTNKKGHSLQSFAVNSLQDSDGFLFQNLYSLTEIIEYDQINQLLYVVMDSKSDYDLYKIDLNHKGAIRRMQVVGWFFYSKTRRETIVGGNSRVLVDATNDRLWIDQNKSVTITKPSLYKKYNIENLTPLRVYTSGSRVYNLISSYFQYISLSMDNLKMSAFVYSGYNKTQPIGEGSLSSKKKPIKFYSDDQSYFVAVADNDIYFTIVYWNETVQEYVVYSRTLRQTVENRTLWPEYIQSFSEALIIVLYRLKFYILTEEALYVENGIQINKMVLKNKVKKTDRLQHVLFTSMLKYEKMQNNTGTSSGY